MLLYSLVVFHENAQFANIVVAEIVHYLVLTGIPFSSNFTDWRPNALALGGKSALMN